MNIALILSGGTGQRLGADLPKQYIEVGKKPVISYCIETLSAHAMIDGIQIVADVFWRKDIRQWLREADGGEKFRGFSDPGENRQLSIFHGLRDIQNYADDMDYVFVHDAARPLLSEKHVTDCLLGVMGHEGLMPALPMKDTVYTSLDGGKSIAALLDRSTVYAGQAPEVFQLGRYYEANRRLLPDRIRQINGSAEPAVLYHMDVVMIPGEEENFKLTTKADLERFRKIVEKRLQTKKQEGRVL